MAAEVLGGRAVSDALTQTLRNRLDALSYTPRLVFVRVGEDPASVYYVRSKGRLAKRVGIEARTQVLDASADEQELLRAIDVLNADPEVDGILVQLPLPAQIEEQRVLERIDPLKDVDGLHPLNVARLWTGQEGLFPATPTGLIHILDHYAIPIEGRRAVVVGRSNLVGKPAAGMLLRRHATVSVAHSRTRDLAGLTRQADILVGAVGRPWLITAEMVKEGATVLDVGITRVDGEIRGDVDPGVAEVAGHLTPMPGGTGLVTVAMVIANTFKAAAARRAAPTRGDRG